jgi:hypothetical protein
MTYTIFSYGMVLSRRSASRSTSPRGRPRVIYRRVFETTYDVFVGDERETGLEGFDEAVAFACALHSAIPSPTSINSPRNRRTVRSPTNLHE